MSLAKSLYYSFISASILLIIGSLFFYFSISLDVKTSWTNETNSSWYDYSLKISNNGLFNIHEAVIKIHDLTKDKNNCYQIDFGNPINLSSKLARCEIERAYDNEVILNCGYILNGGDIYLDWKLLSKPTNCSFIIEYTYSSNRIIPRVKTTSF